MMMMVLDTLKVDDIFAHITCKKHIVLHILNSSIQANNSAQCIFVYILNFLEENSYVTYSGRYTVSINTNS